MTTKSKTTTAQTGSSEGSVVALADQILIERECDRLIMRYSLAVNEWDMDAFVALFAPDAVWQRPKRSPLRGHAEIRAFMDEQSQDRTMRHVNCGSLITVLGTGQAKAVSQTIVYQMMGWTDLPAPLLGTHMVVEYADQFSLIGDEWKITRRDTTQVFSAAVGR